MCDTAAHLVDNVFPEVPVRQWVVTFPFNLRYLFAYQKKALSKALEIVIRAINRHYINRGREDGVKEGKPGSVTLIQRFGSSLNLNVHFHILFPDGIWDESGKFHMPRPLEDDEVSKIVGQIKERVFRALERGGYIDGFQLSESDELALEYPGLAESNSSSIQRKNNRGERVKEIGKYFDLSWKPNEGELCSYSDGFSLHAKTYITAHDREGLERLCRYIARPGISNKRLELREDGTVVLKLKTPYRNGATHLKFTAEEFIVKLIPLVPPPRSNLTRYHGALGPSSKIRRKIVVKNKGDDKGGAPKYKMAWAKLLTGGMSLWRET